jgi:hypothetical protein
MFDILDADRNEVSMSIGNDSENDEYEDDYDNDRVKGFKKM